ncbi:class D sortase [Sporosarcina sp. Te-1]|uniref:class D sortase n=1 Tax=Sporosarcina sp. Te-1 TaxID=2818390 RepID=UPI001A9DDA21|nr:class D sortase [Sporosarcina sp. Te-1]QTD40956.1 class D sortase [Sporosarcina sp. Te-1]
MNRLLRWSGSLLMVAGAGLLIWLLQGNAKQNAQQQEWIDAFHTIQAADHETRLHQEAQKETDEPPQHSVLAGMEGVLSIPTIDLEAPVWLGAEQATLAKGLGAIRDMDEPGVMDGSYAIAGHQARVFGKQFNRLHEVNVGTTFTFQTVDEEMKFKVFDLQIVKPDEVEVLDPQKGKAMMSLITCYPEYSNEYRLVVQAERIDSEQ